MSDERTPHGRAPLRTLIVTGMFAPMGTSHSIRMVYLANELAALGHEVTVLTYDEAALTVRYPYDHALHASVRDDVRVVRIPPGVLHRVLLARKASDADVEGTVKRTQRHPLTQFLIPDPHAPAIAALYRQACALLSETPFDVVLSVAYPFSMHVVGHLIKRRFPDVMWVADYGDPWSGNPVYELHRPSWRVALDVRFERTVLRRCDLVSVTTEPTVHLFNRMFPSTTGRTAVFTMGYDPTIFEQLGEDHRDPDENAPVRLVHVGRLYDEARDTRPFVEALARLARERGLTSRELEVVLVGEVEPTIRERMLASDARHLYTFVPWVEFRESLRWMRGASELLLFGNRGDLQIPGKVFQYVGSARPIMYLCESTADPTLNVLEELDHVRVVRNEASEINGALCALLDNPATSAQSPGAAFEQFSWASIAARFDMEVRSRLEVSGRRKTPAVSLALASSRNSRG